LADQATAYKVSLRCRKPGRALVFQGLSLRDIMAKLELVSAVLAFDATVVTSEEAVVSLASVFSEKVGASSVAVLSASPAAESSAIAFAADASAGASPVSSPQAGKGVRVRASAKARNRDKSRRDHG